MHIAYIISAYKYPEQLERLVRALKTPASTFYIHIDKKTDAAVYDQMRARLAGLEGIHFLKRHACYWGDFGHVRATLKGFDALLRDAVPFDYAVLLTGQDYPIKSPAAIEQRLNAAHPAPFIRCFPLPHGRWIGGGLDRFTHWHGTVFGRHVTFPIQHAYRHRSFTFVWTMLSRLFPLERQVPLGYRPYGGSSYWCLPRDCIAYLHDFVHRNPSFVQFFKHVHVPDELFFQTILMHSPFKETLVDDDLRFILWPPNTPHPAILRTEHFEALMQSDKLFARKFDPFVDDTILRLIDEAIA